MSVQVIGARRLSRTLATCAASLSSLRDAHSTVAQRSTAAARGAAPKRSGRLAGSGTASATGNYAQIAFGVPYAAVIHYGWRARGIAGRQFAWRAVDRDETEEIYRRAVERRLGQVKGA